MKRLLCIGTALAIAALSTNPAQARRTVVDGSGTVNLSGYCDLDGADCTAHPLGFTVNLGRTDYNSFVLYGDGAITFGNTAVSSSTLQNATNLSDFGIPVISSGIDNTLDETFSGGQALQQSGVITSNPGLHEFGGVFTVYVSSTSSKVESTIDIVAYSDHLDVTLNNFSNLSPTGSQFGLSVPFTNVSPQAAGYFIPGGSSLQKPSSSDENSTLVFSIPATVTFGSTATVAELAAWATMIIGFGAIGSALRAARRQRSTGKRRLEPSLVA